MTSVPASRLRELQQRLRKNREQRARLERERVNLENRLSTLQSTTRRSKTSNGNGRRGGAGRSDKDLLRAAEDRDLRSVRQYLKDHADPNARNADGEPVLLVAASAPGNLRVVRELMNAGADVDAADGSGTTPLIACVRDTDLPVVKELVKRGADVNASNSAGDTPLTNAACWGSRKVVRYLLSQGADPHMADGLRISPAELARQQGHDDIACDIERAIHRAQK